MEGDSTAHLLTDAITSRQRKVKKNAVQYNSHFHSSQTLK